MIVDKRSKGNNRLGEIRLNNQGCLMKIVEYNNCKDIIVEFQDEHKGIVHTVYQAFYNGRVKNPYFNSVFGVARIGSKYPSRKNNVKLKEYILWHAIIERCFNHKTKEKYPKYKDITCCNEWLLYENFYEWLHAQENFDRWLSGYRWCIDKDILIKGNKVYSPETCCLVPDFVNILFIKADKMRGDLPIGVMKDRNKYRACCNDRFTGKVEYLGVYETVEEAFYTYKKYKENLIKKIAQEEFSKGNITKQCYDSMMNYEVDIDD